MTLAEAKEFTWWLARLWALVFLVAIAFAVLPFGRDDTDGDWPNRSGVTPRTDALTGCQYLETSDGGITPRLGIDGRQIGCRDTR